MSRASTEMEMMRTKMRRSLDRLSPEDIKAMLMQSITLANTFEMTEMAAATSFRSFQEMDLQLDLTA